MNINSTKYLTYETEEQQKIILEDKGIENVYTFVYPGQQFELSKNNLTANPYSSIMDLVSVWEITGSIQIGFTEYTKSSDLRQVCVTSPHLQRQRHGRLMKSSYISSKSHCGP